jgi:hypothetical protein
VVFEAKMGFSNIEKAKESCRKRLREGIADVCFAMAYDESFAYASSSEEIKEKLRNAPLRLTVITAPNIRGVNQGTGRPLRGPSLTSLQARSGGLQGWHTGPAEGHRLGARA